MVDVLLVLMLGGAAVLGWRRGLAVSLIAGLVFALAGLPVAAIAAATGLLPPALGFVIGGLLALVPFALRLQAIADRLDLAFQDDRLRVANQVGGALLNLGVATCIAWFVAALASIAPGDSGGLAAMRSSSVLDALVDAVPAQGPLGVMVLRSGLVPSVNGPLVLAEEPNPASAQTPQVLAARASVLQVRSSACNNLVSGTGWVAGDGIVVTNAHVVAGSQRSFLSGGPQYEGVTAQVTAFDPVNDIAVLTLAPGQTAQLPRALQVVPRVEHGEPGAVIGYPKGGRQTAEPARIDRVAPYDIEPLGGGAPVSSQVLAFRAFVQSGNSGGPLVAEDGSVLGLVVSRALGQRIDAGYGVASAQLLEAIRAGADRVPVSTGPCLEAEDLRKE